MRKKYVVALPEPERAQFHSLLGHGAAAARPLTHARILRKANQGAAGPGWTAAAIAGALEVDPATGARVRRLYVTVGLEAALQRKVPARVYERTRDDGRRDAHRVALACGAPPEGQARWTLGLLAGALVRLEVVERIATATVRRALKQTNSSPG